MGYIVLPLVGAIGGGICVFVAMFNRHLALQRQKQYQAERAEEINEKVHALNARYRELEQQSRELAAAREEFDRQVVSYKELQVENAILKRDLRNTDLAMRKLRLDHNQHVKTQHEFDEKAQQLAVRYLKETVKWISSALNPNNYANCKQRLQDVVERCRAIGFEIPPDEEARLIADLKAEFEKVVRAALEREEQARIRAQIREEQLREREIQRELQQAERERQAIQAALAKALAEAHDTHSEEVERLEARLAEAEAKSQRAISQAQLTKAGHVYVVSNIGSFGEGVFKIGMTRRLEPLQRVMELGDASVPFPFDVHMMVSSDDAPSLENALHRKLHKVRINRVNPRREFFRTAVDEIYQIVKDHHGEVEYVADAEALQYRQSIAMPDDDQEFIDHVYNVFDHDDDLPADESSLRNCDEPTDAAK